VHYGPLSRAQLVQEIERRNFSKDPYGAVASLMSNNRKSYGMAFRQQGGLVSVHPEIEDEVRKHHWASE